MDSKPDRRPRLPQKPSEPASLTAAIERARARTLKRDTSAPIQIARDADGRVLLDADGRYRWDWPFEGEISEWPAWAYMVLDAFGTRNASIAATFLRHLMELCASNWDEGVQAWVEDDGEIQMMLSIVRSHKPKNEAQAAQAASVAATHIITMRVAKRVAQSPHDTRMISAYARLLQASAALAEASGGGRKPARQSIKVTRETHVHHHQHVHVKGGGEENENRDHGTRRPEKIEVAALAGECTPLPCNEPGGEVVRLAGRKG